jgi:hypothetical protein
MQTQIFHNETMICENASAQIALNFAYDYFAANCGEKDLLTVIMKISENDSRRVYFYVDESGDFVLDHGENDCGDSITFSEPDLGNFDFDSEFASEKRTLEFFSAATKI